MTGRHTDFNPRSHEGSDRSVAGSASESVDFNPRSHEGSDLLETCFSPCTTYFNPRSHEGSDLPHPGFAYPAKISIHAPTRGATISMISLQKVWQNFNPRSHEGSDALIRSTPAATSVFQSTLPRGERRGRPLTTFTTYWNFNPRSHEGSDIQFKDMDEAQVISIHAPTRGATRTDVPVYA